MTNTIRLKFTQTTGRQPNTTNAANGNYVVPGELALNIIDGKIYTNYANTVMELGPKERANNVFFVSKSGLDTNDGRSLAAAKLTIKSAIAAANSLVPSVIMVKTGDYTEENPCILANNMVIIGDSPKTTIVRPQFTTQDMFHLKQGGAVIGIACKDHLTPAAAFTFPDISAPSSVGSSNSASKEIDVANINFTTNFISMNNTGSGANLFANGTAVVYSTTTAAPIGGLSNNEALFVIGANSTGIKLTKSPDVLIAGTLAANGNGYYALTVAANSAVINIPVVDFTVTSSVGAANASGNGHFLKTVSYITNQPEIFDCLSETTTGYGIKADGAKVAGFRGFKTNKFVSFNAGGVGLYALNQGKIQGDSVVSICSEDAALVDTGGMIVLTGSRASYGNNALHANGMSQTIAFGTVANNLTLNTIKVTGLTEAPKIGSIFQISTVANTQFTVKAAANSSGDYIITTPETIPSSVAAGANVNFYIRSLIIAHGQSFDYVGTGTDLTDAIPLSGGVVSLAKEAVKDSGGAIYYSSFDQFGDFRFGSGILINNAGDKIEGTTFVNSLLTAVTPYILAIGD